jgi:hypothetical protein
VSGRIRVFSAGDGWRVELPQFGFVALSSLVFPSHAEALAYAVAEADRRRGPVSLYVGVGGEEWGPWTLKSVRR